MPRAPATVAAFAGAAAFFLLLPSFGVQVVMLVAAVAIGQLYVTRAVQADGRDPQYVVIDEVAGVWLALLGLPLDLASCAIGAVVFRGLDKLKPGPIRAIDERGGRFALMGDDLAAGLVTNIVLRAGWALHGWLV